VVNSSTDNGQLFLAFKIIFTIKSLLHQRANQPQDDGATILKEDLPVKYEICQIQLVLSTAVCSVQCAVRNSSTDNGQLFLTFEIIFTIKSLLHQRAQTAPR